MSPRCHLGWNPMPRKPRPSSSPTALTSRRWLRVSRQVSWMVCSGAPDSSSWPAGSRVTEAPSLARAIRWPCSSLGSQPNRVRPRKRAPMPRSPSQVGGRRSSRRKPNFSCSVPMRQSAAGLQPATRNSTSSRRSLIGLSLALLGPDTGPALGTIVGMRMLTRALPLGVLLAALLCSGPALAGDGRLERGNGPEPSTLDAHRCPAVACANIRRDLYEGLVAEDGAGRLIPGMAERWEVSADGRTWTFRLREGLRWSNGEALDAGQVAASFRRALDPATAAPFAHHFDAVRDITAPDPGTLVFRLERSLDLPRLLVLPIAYPV